MVLAVEARKLDLPHLSNSSPQVTSLLYDPNSLSLALMHSDSTFSIFPSFSPFSLSPSPPSLPPPQTLICPPSSSACFLNLDPKLKFSDSPDRRRVAFVTAGPHDGASKVVLRFYLLGKNGKFGNAQIVCTQKGLRFDGKLGVIVDASHGMKVLLAGSVNYVAMYSSTAGKIWVFGARLAGNERDLRLVKCAVIDCHLPVLSICVSFGFLVLGELHGVRVFPLRTLAKGRVGNRRRVCGVRGKVENVTREQQDIVVSFKGRNSKMPNGVVCPLDESCMLDKNHTTVSGSKSMDMCGTCNVLVGVSSNASVESNHEAVKLRSLKLRQDSGEAGMQFIFFGDWIAEGITPRVLGYKTRKAISIRALSQHKFLILDSNGELHLLHMLNSSCFEMRQLTGVIQVQQLAAFPDMSASMILKIPALCSCCCYFLDGQNAWISDGLCSLHKIVISDAESIKNENDKSSSEGNTIQSSVTEVIFASENIRDIVALAANSIMILGRDSLYAYAIS